MMAMRKKMHEIFGKLGCLFCIMTCVPDAGIKGGDK